MATIQWQGIPGAQYQNTPGYISTYMQTEEPVSLIKKETGH